MNDARGELFEALTSGGWNLAPGEADDMNRLIDAFAHKLAEKARKIMGPRRLPSGAEPEKIARYVNGWNDAADFIDPEVPNA
ncbi:hypothetical protein [Streptomyces sp. NBC_01212]|uniref:hypothetical protein n=1 Tax=Streptomyces sp. NBC_01212 TaxID=2903775 RepID=UPI002E163079|nr:hypothetical protein OG722_05075 [Streptomyces sp. NBC_01212]